jgi:pimeloyl-ACP methyl ester carboxylesterase
MRDEVIERPGGRQVAFADFGPGDGTAVLWCHAGPGSRHEPAYVAEAAAAAGLRLVGVDRPGYGRSNPQPGRSIADWVPEALAVADRLAIDRFVTVGLSTGGAYALAVAAVAPERVLGVVLCCSLTDMRCEEARATVSRPHAHTVWDAPDRNAAIAAAVEPHGRNGRQTVETAEGPPLAPSDQAMITSRWGQLWLEDVPNMFAHGLEGYADDRIADGPGWVSFDVTSIGVPVIVLHGARDVIADVIHAQHTVGLIPGAECRIIDSLGHFSIIDEIVPTLAELRDRVKV